jgi:integrase
MGKLSHLVRTRESYYEKISDMSLSSRKGKRFAIESFERFASEKYKVGSCEVMIEEMKGEKDENIIYDILQEWIKWETLKDVKNRFTHLNGYFYYHGIKISSQDVRHNLKMPKKMKREQYAAKIEELQDIMNPIPFYKKALYLALISSGMRIGEALRIRKKDLDFSRSRIMITVSSDVAKNGMARITWMSKEAERYNIKKINLLQDDDDLVWGSDNVSQWQNNVIGEGVMFARYADNAKLDMKYDSGTRKITLHSLRAYFITKGNKTDFGFGHALAGNDYYMKSYDRYDPDELFDMYLKLEPHLGIFDLTQKNQQISDLQTANKELLQMKKMDDQRWESVKTWLGNNPDTDGKTIRLKSKLSA